MLLFYGVFSFISDFVFCLCDSANENNSNFENTVTPYSTIYTFQLFSSHMLNNKVEDLPFELTTWTTFVEV